ncbi:hypothetical protein NDU88_005956 [Pleurodeles waltl]|uniref:Uncharacterized protein n=1 Tax=Pleurodeles waltl TaxID=8319 RepID=A0AAV7N0W0_PLEWA|nr:hypothetical protein NDU88_005956 [Pleurodeles waltl]
MPAALFRFVPLRQSLAPFPDGIRPGLTPHRPGRRHRRDHQPSAILSADCPRRSAPHHRAGAMDGSSNSSRGVEQPQERVFTTDKGGLDAQLKVNDRGVRSTTRVRTPS